MEATAVDIMTNLSEKEKKRINQIMWIVDYYNLRNQIESLQEFVECAKKDNFNFWAYFSHFRPDFVPERKIRWKKSQERDDIELLVGERAYKICKIPADINVSVYYSKEAKCFEVEFDPAQYCIEGMYPPLCRFYLI